MQNALGIKDDDHMRLAYIVPAMADGLIEMTIPDKPQSRLQKYRLTDKGRSWLATQTDAGKKRPCARYSIEKSLPDEREPLISSNAMKKTPALLQLQKLQAR